jgi:hypothetical protein
MRKETPMRVLMVGRLSAWAAVLGCVRPAQMATLPASQFHRICSPER